MVVEEGMRLKRLGNIYKPLAILDILHYLAGGPSSSSHFQKCVRLLRHLLDVEECNREGNYSSMYV